MKWWTSTPAALRFGPAEYLLRALSGGAANLDQFWLSVVERMKRYGFYFVDPRLVSIEFRGTGQNQGPICRQLTLLFSEITCYQ
jgi:hypothetical protein